MGETVFSKDGVIKEGEREMMNGLEMYVHQMNAWIKEQEAGREQIVATIETSSELVEKNKKQL